MCRGEVGKVCFECRGGGEGGKERGVGIAGEGGGGGERVGCELGKNVVAMLNDVSELLFFCRWLEVG